MVEKNFELRNLEDEVPVLITFAWHDQEGTGGESTEPFFITKEEYEKFQAYYDSYAHYIGVMINNEMPRIRKMIEEDYYYLRDIFILDIVYDGDGIDNGIAGTTSRFP